MFSAQMKLASSPAVSRGTRQPFVAPCQLSRTVARPQRSVVVLAAGVEKVTAEQLEVAIMERDTPLIIDFYADWCGPCQLLAKELEKVKGKLGEKVRILKVNTDENTQLATQLQIYGLPTIIFVSPNKEKPSLRTEGLLPAETIMEIVEKELM